MFSKSYDKNGKEITFNFDTADVRYTVVFDGESFEVKSQKDGIKVVRAMQKNGIMAQLKIERLHYVKFCHAIDNDGMPVYRYVRHWKRVN